MIEHCQTTNCSKNQKLLFEKTCPIFRGGTGLDFCIRNVQFLIADFAVTEYVATQPFTADCKWVCAFLCDRFCRSSYNASGVLFV